MSFVAAGRNKIDDLGESPGGLGFLVNNFIGCAGGLGFHGFIRLLISCLLRYGQSWQDGCFNAMVTGEE
jgi:hypothetical protein